ncbi:MAG: hypothetical protein ABI672_13490 [Vicinamibacteria bacterium]
MTFLILALTVLTAVAPQSRCALPQEARSKPRVFTNADLDRMSACRYETGAESEVGSGSAATRDAASGRSRRPTKSKASGDALRSESHANTADAGSGFSEADWRAQWRSVDQKTRRLRNEARALRQEASEIPRDPKKKPVTGRRSSSLLETQARNLEAEARELEDEFQQRARREGALPGWLRPKVR